MEAPQYCQQLRASQNFTMIHISMIQNDAETGARDTYLVSSHTKEVMLEHRGPLYVRHLPSKQRIHKQLTDTYCRARTNSVTIIVHSGCNGAARGPVVTFSGLFRV